MTPNILCSSVRKSNPATHVCGDEEIRVPTIFQNTRGKATLGCEVRNQCLLKVGECMRGRGTWDWGGHSWRCWIEGTQSGVKWARMDRFRIWARVQVERKWFLLEGGEGTISTGGEGRATKMWEGGGVAEMVELGVVVAGYSIGGMLQGERSATNSFRER